MAWNISPIEDKGITYKINFEHRPEVFDLGYFFEHSLLGDDDHGSQDTPGEVFEGRADVEDDGDEGQRGEETRQLGRAADGSPDDTTSKARGEGEDREEGGRHSHKAKGIQFLEYQVRMKKGCYLAMVDLIFVAFFDHLGYGNVDGHRGNGDGCGIQANGADQVKPRKGRGRESELSEFLPLKLPLLCRYVSHHVDVVSFR